MVIQRRPFFFFVSETTKIPTGFALAVTALADTYYIHIADIMSVFFFVFFEINGGFIHGV